jgi:hypothetical protein
MITRNQLVPNFTEMQVSDQFLNPRGAGIVTQDLPERTEVVRLGNSWAIRTAEVACVTAVPTTTAPHYLWNGEPAGGKSYIIDNLGWMCTTSAGAASMFAMLVCLNVLPLTSAPATADALEIASLNGRNYSGKAKTGHTATVIDDKWWPLGNVVNSNALTATVGCSIWQFVEGSIIVPPGYLLNLACIAVNATAKGKFVIQYHEVQLPVVTN